MLNIQPKTYNDALRLCRCLTMRRYAPNITDDMIEDMYNFISCNTSNKVGISGGMLYYVDFNGVRRDVHTVETVAGFDQIIMGATVFHVVNTSTSSGCSGCSGCSCNNNNNNNNNNNG